MSNLEQFSNLNGTDSRNAGSGLADEYNSISKSDLLSYQSNRSQDRSDTIRSTFGDLELTTDSSQSNSLDCNPRQRKPEPGGAPAPSDRSQSVDLGRRLNGQDTSKIENPKPAPIPPIDRSQSSKVDLGRLLNGQEGPTKIENPNPAPVPPIDRSQSSRVDLGRLLNGQEGTTKVEDPSPAPIPPIGRPQPTKVDLSRQSELVTPTLEPVYRTKSP